MCLLSPMLRPAHSPDQDWIPILPVDVPLHTHVSNHICIITFSLYPGLSHTCLLKFIVRLYWFVWHSRQLGLSDIRLDIFFFSFTSSLRCCTVLVAREMPLEAPCAFRLTPRLVMSSFKFHLGFLGGLCRSVASYASPSHVFEYPGSAPLHVSYFCLKDSSIQDPCCVDAPVRFHFPTTHTRLRCCSYSWSKHDTSRLAAACLGIAYLAHPQQVEPNTELS